MDFKEFADRMEQDVRNALADGSPGVRVTQNQMQKLQDESYTALSVFPADGNIAMNINLNQLYEAVQEGAPYGTILRDAIGKAENYLKTGGMSVDVSQMMDYEKAKELLCVEVIGTDRNKEMLEKIPHTELEDLSMVYRLQLNKNEDGLATVLITNEMLKSYGISLEQLHADAVENSIRIRPAVFKSMQEIMAEMAGLPVDEMQPDMLPLYVVTNKSSTEKINNGEKKETRHRYGTYQNVLLSDAEMETVKREFPSDYMARIERMSEYIASTGKGYKNYLAALRSWARREKPKYSAAAYQFEEGDSL